MAVAIRPLTDDVKPTWDRFVDQHAGGTFFHRADWSSVLSKAFRHASLYAYAERDGAVTGILPLVHVKTALFGNSLISSPFCVYGGPLCADAETEVAFEAYVDRALDGTKAESVEYRLREEPVAAQGWAKKDDLYVTFRKPIERDDTANLNAIPRKQRAMVRKGIQRGLQSKADSDISTLHKVYAESVRNLGTPVFSRRYFQLLSDVFRDRMDVVTVLDGDLPVASVLNFYDRGEVLPYYGGGTAGAREVAANDFMYWEVMRRAAARGCSSFDFGRSKVGTGAYAFKKNWGFSPTPIYHRFKLKSGAKIPDHNPLNPKYRMMIAAWKRLPLPIANWLGPFIVRGVG